MMLLGSCAVRFLDRSIISVVWYAKYFVVVLCLRAFEESVRFLEKFLDLVGGWMVFFGEGER